ncbi:MAG: nucleotidyltransferase domain-containing protein [Ardenticatenaceae bacterium]|nr:nucleotidyltransferase domain-containing protein [Ardenticatenaceae bacterium]
MLSLTSVETQAIIEFVTVLRNEFESDLFGVVLYGSKARNDATTDSDIDLLVILSDDDWQTRKKVSHLSAAISIDYDALLMPKIVPVARWRQMVMTPFSFYRAVFQDGLPVYGEPVIFAPLVHRDVALFYDTAVTV